MFDKRQHELDRAGVLTHEANLLTPECPIEDLTAAEVLLGAGCACAILLGVIGCMLAVGLTAVCWIWR